MEYKLFKLSDIAEVIVSGVDKKSKPGQKQVRLCNFTDVYYNWAISSSLYDSFMVATAKEKEIEALSVKKGFVALTKDSETRFDIGISTYIADDFEDVVLGYHCALIKPDSKQLNGKYLNCLLHTQYARTYFANNAKGSGQRYSLTQDCLNDMKIPMPMKNGKIDMEYQRKIGNLFSSIDEKIELNKQINRDLEDLARLIYDYWFVQFDFPDAIGKPYKSSGGKMVWNAQLKREIPEGWEVGAVFSHIDLFDSKRVPLSSKQREQKKGYIPYYGATGIMDYVDDFLFDGEYILLAEDGSVETDDGKVIVQTIWGKSWVNNHAHIIQPKNKEQYLFYAQHLSRIKAKKIMSGSIQKKISQDNMKKYFDVIPPNSTIKKYCDSFLPMWEHFKRTVEETNLLTKQRDFLLPLLMNGQVKIKQR